MFGGTGILIAILIIAITPMILPVANAGTLVIKVTDAPVDLKHLNLTVDSFEVKNKTDSWISIPITGGRISFDLLSLNGVTLDAAMSNLKPGNYTMIRMHVVEGLAFTNATSNIEGSQPFAVRVPSEKIKIPVEFEIKTGDTTIVILDIMANAEWRISIANNPENNLNPVIKPTVIPPKST
ncbi:MAG: hypothetical protein QG670_718 [Thermoproteota archaeon]|nr:hypothetical protein [Thermoproteota archaeon]